MKKQAEKGVEVRGVNMYEQEERDVGLQGTTTVPKGGVGGGEEEPTTHHPPPWEIGHLAVLSGSPPARLQPQAVHTSLVYVAKAMDPSLKAHWRSMRLPFVLTCSFAKLQHSHRGQGRDAARVVHPLPAVGVVCGM